jgi:hypothetical protein
MYEYRHCKDKGITKTNCLMDLSGEFCILYVQYTVVHIQMNEAKSLLAVPKEPCSKTVVMQHNKVLLHNAVEFATAGSLNDLSLISLFLHKKINKKMTKTVDFSLLSSFVIEQP